MSFGRSVRRALRCAKIAIRADPQWLRYSARVPSDLPRGPQIVELQAQAAGTCHVNFTYPNGSSSSVDLTIRSMWRPDGSPILTDAARSFSQSPTPGRLVVQVHAFFPFRMTVVTLECRERWKGTRRHRGRQSRAIRLYAKQRPAGRALRYLSNQAERALVGVGSMLRVAQTVAFAGSRRRLCGVICGADG